MLRLTSYIGTRPVQRHELRDITTGVSDFQVQIPADLPTIEETRTFPYLNHPNIAAAPRPSVSSSRAAAGRDAPAPAMG